MSEFENLQIAPVPAKTPAQRMIDAAICAYSIRPTGYFPAPFFAQPVGFVAPPYTLTDGEADIDAGLLGITDDNWAVLSLRGTLSHYDSFSQFISVIYDWLQDDETHFVPLISSDGTNLGKVHKGFHKATMKLWPYFRSIMRSFDWSNLNGLRITGHSKGAGMTFIFAALANAEKNYMKAGGPKNIEVHAFAAPLAGNPDFATKYHSQGLNKTSIRYQRPRDIVPFLAPYLSFDLLHQVDLWDARFDFELDAAIEYLRLTVTRGYELVGDLEFYPDHTAGSPWPNPIPGHTGQILAQAAILGAIQGGYKDEIAAAHSAINSYWPAIFKQDLPKPSLEVLTAGFEAALEQSC